MNDPSVKFISVHVLTNRFEADLLQDALEREEIPFFIRSFEETPYNGLFVSQRGWGKIMVPENFRNRAQELIATLLDDVKSKRMYSDPSEIDHVLWERLQTSDRQLTCKNAQVRFDGELGAFLLPFLDSELACSPEKEEITLLKWSPFHTLDFELYLTTLHYLLEAQGCGISGKWISEKDIPGGQMFFKGPHRFPTEPLLELFGSKPEVFQRASELLDGSQVPGIGDIAYRFWPFPRTPLLFILWEGDEEFEARLHIRFDETITLHLRTLDTIWALVNVMCRSLNKAARSIVEEGAV